MFSFWSVMFTLHVVTLKIYLLPSLTVMQMRFVPSLIMLSHFVVRLVNLYTFSDKMLGCFLMVVHVAQMVSMSPGSFSENVVFVYSNGLYRCTDHQIRILPPTGLGKGTPKLIDSKCQIFRSIQHIEGLLIHCWVQIWHKFELLTENLNVRGQGSI